MNDKTANQKWTSEILSMMKDAAPLDFDKAQQIAAATGLSVRAIVAKAKFEKIPYTPKARESKNGDPVESKAAIVEQIAGLMGVDSESIESLEKATKNTLKAVRKALKKEK